jgi:plastocyanin
MGNKSKKILIIAVLVIALAAVITLAFLQGRRSSDIKTPTPVATPTGESETSGESAAGEVLSPEEINEVLKDAVVTAPGADLITKDNKVVNVSGQETKTDVEMSSSLAPTLTKAIEKEDLAPTAINLDVSAAGFSPSEFTVKAGAPVTLAISAIDGLHNLVFEDPAMSAVGLTARPGQTRAVTFSAPTEKGEYVFYCNVGGTLHKNRGEVGTMIVE